MNFDLSNRSKKIWKSIGTPIPKVGAHLRECGLIPSHSPHTPKSVNVTFRLHSLPAPFHAPYVGREPKAKVMIMLLWQKNFCKLLK
jgi:hypothetical protein